MYQFVREWWRKRNELKNNKLHFYRTPASAKQKLKVKFSTDIDLLYQKTTDGVLGSNWSDQQSHQNIC
jgi:hypothetical protein